MIFGRPLAGIARDECQVVNFDCCRDECVRDAERPPHGLATRHGLPPNIGNRVVDWQDSPFEAKQQLAS
jgi:hypothetical protein